MGDLIHAIAQLVSDHWKFIMVVAFLGAFVNGCVASRLGKHPAGWMLLGALVPALSVAVVCATCKVLPENAS